MTGGALPAMTWHAIMEYAHQGIDIKQLPGLPVPPARPQLVADSGKKNAETPPPRPRLLSKRAADVLVNIEHTMDEANRALGPLPSVASETPRQASADKSDEDDALTAALEGRAFVRN
jgi:penicillin-binding protein 1A